MANTARGSRARVQSSWRIECKCGLLIRCATRVEPFNQRECLSRLWEWGYIFGGDDFNTGLLWSGPRLPVKLALVMKRELHCGLAVLSADGHYKHVSHFQRVWKSRRNADLQVFRASGSRPAPGTRWWWRRGDSTSAAFAAGWTMPSSTTLFLTRLDAERVIPPSQNRRDPSARPGITPSASLWVSTGQAWSWPSSYPSALPCRSR